jgi:neutral trehalase
MLEGGLVTTLALDIKQQWDYPNAWAPLQHMIIEGFEMADTSETKFLARKLAGKWIASNYVSSIHATLLRSDHMLPYEIIIPHLLSSNQ